MALPGKRRRHARIEAAGISSHLRVRDNILMGLPVENISLGGMFVTCTEPYSVGTPLRIELMKNGIDQPLHIEGKVVASINEPASLVKNQHPGMGIAFAPMSDAVGERLRDLLLELTVLARQLVQENESLRAGGAIQLEYSDLAPEEDHLAFRALPAEGERIDVGIGSHTPTAPLTTLTYGRNAPASISQVGTPSKPWDVPLSDLEIVRGEAFDFNFKTLDPLDLPDAPSRSLGEDALSVRPTEEWELEKTHLRLAQSPSGYTPPPGPAPLRIVPADIDASADADGSITSGPEASAELRLKVQLQGLLLELGDARADLVRAWQERDTLREDNTRMKKELSHLRQWVTQLETMIKDGRTDEKS